MPHSESAVATTEEKLGSYADDRKRWCQMARQSGLVPKGLDTDAKVFVAIEAGMEAGFSPMQALKSVYVINGMPCLTGKATMSLILQANVCKIPPSASWGGEGDDYGCTITFQRNSHPKPVSVRFTVGDAKRAGLWQSKDVWKKYPDNMLQWRAVSNMSDMYFADLTAGLGVMETVADHRVTVEREKSTEIDPLLIRTDEKPAEVEYTEPEIDPDTGEKIPDEILHPETPE